LENAQSFLLQSQVRFAFFSGLTLLGTLICCFAQNHVSQGLLTARTVKKLEIKAFLVRNAWV